ncbi:MAG: efflux RND transporter periplasmic adaptor subunit [Acidobacteria bacterium]|nr:MAG: efflux RND transporter periplasmic adaptor subunit [Acidobacteriota bacterium]
MAANHQLDQVTASSPSVVPHRKSHFGFLALLVLLGIALAAGIVFELTQRKTQEKTLAATIAEDANRPPAVNVGRVRAASSSSTVELPGQTVALVETPIYARADGYLKQRPVDIGYRVQKGQLLVEIETPELDQQISQARATLAQSRAALQQLRASLLAARSNLKLAQVTADRWKKLTEEGVFSRQDLDEKMAALESGQANVQAAEESVRAAESTAAANEANLKRLEELQTFDRLVAPFDGVITARSLQSDVGTLISSGNTASSREIMRIAQIGVLRVFVSIPQTYAPMIHDGLPAEVRVDELPGRLFPTKVSGTTHSVESSSRTMLAVLLVQNQEELLLPGMYAKVRFSLPHKVNVLMLPADGLVLKSDGPQAAVVGPDRKVHFQKLTLGRDYGAEIEVHSGLADGDRVVLNPTDAIREGVIVEPKERAK